MCKHPKIDVEYIPQASRDSDVVVMTMRMRCPVCGPLRFVGASKEVTVDCPTMSEDGGVIYIPVVPETRAEQPRYLS